MGAFLASEAVMQDVTTELLELGRSTGLMIDGVVPTTTHDATEAGRKLLAMNYRALGMQVPEVISFLFRPAAASANRMARFKALQCLRHQCDAIINAETTLFADLDRACGRSAEAVVTGMQHYHLLPWGRHQEIVHGTRIKGHQRA